MELFEIEKYIRELQDDENKFKQLQTKSYHEDIKTKKPRLKHTNRRIMFLILSVYDYILLRILLRFNKDNIRSKRIVYTSKNFCTEKDGILEDRIVKPLFKDNILFINQSKEIRLEKVNGQIVYNLGGLVKIISHFPLKEKSLLMSTFKAYRIVNDSIIKHLSGNELYMLWFYDLNSLSLIFSKYRERVKLVEVQHGSIVNYPPYVKPAPVKIADLFYVKNQQTIDYLKAHLCSEFPSDYRLIPYPQVERQYVPGLHILYASTLEFNGIHPVFRDFLKKNKFTDLHVIVRLHPRELDKQALFESELSEFNINFEFDNSKNWLQGNMIKNLIVVSPWSSVIEDAVDNGFTTIIIDEVGLKRFSELIDSGLCYYSSDLMTTIQHEALNEHL